MRRARSVRIAVCAVIAGSILVPTGVADAGGGCHTSPSGAVTQARAAAGDAFAAVIEECAFQPTVLYVEPGSEVTWVNKDIFEHTVTGANVSWGSERFLSQGDTITQRFTKEGVFPYYCLLHPGMVGAVVVGDPDPADVAEKTSTIDSTGIETGASGDLGSGGSNAEEGVAPVTSDPASDSIPTPLLLGTIALLGLAAAVAFTLVRRRGRVEQGA